MAGKTAVVLGGGIGGLVAARELRRRLPAEDRVVLVDKAAQHLFPPSLLWVMTGDRQPQALVRDLDRQRRHGIDVRQTEVTAIAAEQRRVSTADGDIDFDALVIALGAELAPDAMPGFAEAAHTPYKLDGAVALRDAARAFAGGRVLVLVSSLPYKCPAAPYETALLLESLFRRRGVRRDVELEIVTPEPSPLPVAGPVLGQAVQELLAARGIAYRPSTAIASVDPSDRAVVTQEGERIPFDLLAGVPPHRSPAAIRESGLANEAGWLPVDKNTLATKFEGVYAIGDVAAVTLPSGAPLPKAGIFAERQAKAVARSIAAAFGSGTPATFDGRGGCFIEMGDGVAGYAEGNFYAEPKPDVSLRRSGRYRHWQKVLFEKWWMWRWAR